MTLLAFVLAMLRAHAMSRTFWLINLQVHARLMLCANHAQQCADSLGGLALAANNLTHIFWIQVQGDEHTHFIYRAIRFDLFRMVNEGFNYVLYKLLILLLHVLFRYGLLCGPKAVRMHFEHIADLRLRQLKTASHLQKQGTALLSVDAGALLV